MKLGRILYGIRSRGSYGKEFEKLSELGIFDDYV